MCTRFIPLIRDAEAWRELHAEQKEDSSLPQGTPGVYMQRGWCQLEIVAALCPKRYGSGKFRAGPTNLRFRFHENPEDPGCGPPITAAHLRDPRTGDFYNPEDVELIKPVLQVIAEEFTAYEASGSNAWDSTIDVSRRPQWLKNLAPLPPGAQVRGAQVRVAPTPALVEVGAVVDAEEGGKGVVDAEEGGKDDDLRSVEIASTQVETYDA